jgi:hypothetical protein
LITSPLFVVPLIVVIFFSALLWATGGHKGSATTPTTDEPHGKMS